MRHLNNYSSAPVPLPEPELYVIYTGEKEIEKKYITLSEEFFDGRKVAVDASVRVLKYNGGSDIVEQYIFFCKTLDEQRKLYPEDGMKAINETIRICLEAGVLTEYLRNRKEEVVSIMLTLYSQEQATEMMQKNLLRIGRLEGQIQNTVEMCQEFGKTKAEAISLLSRKFAFSHEEAAAMFRKYSELM